jgi:formylglycine-generating enzyme required for sulfatase activity
VGSFPANSFDLVDLAGNAAEWCADWYANDYYEKLRPDPDKSAHRNPRGPETSSDPTSPGQWKRVVRGGSWMSAENEYRCASRSREAPEFTAEWIGFRCVKNGG